MMVVQPLKLLTLALLVLAEDVTSVRFQFLTIQYPPTRADTVTVTISTTECFQKVLDANQFAVDSMIEIRGGSSHSYHDDDDDDDDDDRGNDEDDNGDDDDDDMGMDHNDDKDQYLPTRSRPRPRPNSQHSHSKSASSSSSSSSSLISMSSAVARSTVDWTTRAAWYTLKGAGTAAVQMASPAHRRPLTRLELVGRWRLDQCRIVKVQQRRRNKNNNLGSGMPTRSIMCAANVELTRDGYVLVTVKDPEYPPSDTALSSSSSTSVNTKTLTTKYKFSPQAWPQTSRVEFVARAFQGPNDSYPILIKYEGYIRRKVADPQVLKIVGKMYEINPQTGKVGKHCIGTFVARRRLSKTSTSNSIQNEQRRRRIPPVADLDDDEEVDDDLDDDDDGREWNSDDMRDEYDLEDNSDNDQDE